jgi:hypothetical protein
MRTLMIAVLSLALAATTGFAQARRGGGAYRGGHAAGVARGYAGPSRGFAGPGRVYGGGYYRGYGFGLGLGLGYAPYAPSCSSAYYPYGCGYPAYGYYAAPVPRVVVPPVIVGGGWRRFRR